MKQLLYFFAKWCGPCRFVSPTMQQLSQEGISVKKIDIDENFELANRYNIRSVPTVVMIKNNQETGRVVGNQSKNTYIKLWNK